MFSLLFEGNDETTVLWVDRVSKLNPSAATAHCKYILILLTLDLIFQLPLKILGWGQWLNNLCEAQWSCYKKYYVIAKAFLHRKLKTIKNKPLKLIVSIFPSLMQTYIRANIFKRNCIGFQVKNPRTYCWGRERIMTAVSPGRHSPLIKRDPLYTDKRH